MRSPFRSNRSLIAPVRLRRVASGLMIDRVRSAAIASLRSSGRGAGYSGHACRGQSGRLLPPRRGLLPVSQRVAGGLGRAPALARGCNGAFVLAVEQVEGSGEGVEVRGGDA